MNLTFGAYRCGSWRLHICLTMIGNGIDNFSYSCKEFRLEEDSMKLMFENVNMTQLIEYEY